MTAKKFTISFDEDLHHAVHAAAAASEMPVSTWLARSAQATLADQAALADGLEAAREELDEHGPPQLSAEDRAWVSRVLADADAGRRRHEQAAS